MQGKYLQKFSSIGCVVAEIQKTRWETMRIFALSGSPRACPLFFHSLSSFKHQFLASAGLSINISIIN
jgi:hypothetical protein